MAWGLAVLSHQPSLDIDMHRRKWSLTIQGLKGAADEDEDTTRQACVNLAKQHLKITDASVFDFSSCHRLANKENAGIIIRFKDFATSITAVDKKIAWKAQKSLSLRKERGNYQKSAAMALCWFKDCKWSCYSPQCQRRRRRAFCVGFPPYDENARCLNTYDLWHTLHTSLTHSMWHMDTDFICLMHFYS